MNYYSFKSQLRKKHMDLMLLLWIIFLYIQLSEKSTFEIIKESAVL